MYYHRPIILDCVIVACKVLFVDKSDNAVLRLLMLLLLLLLLMTRRWRRRIDNDISGVCDDGGAWGNAVDDDDYIAFCLS